jgi:hypothetical protein
MLIRFWFRTEGGLGYGVTASDRAEAELLLAAYGYPEKTQRVVEIIENASLSSLDQNHVIPNSGPVVVRGVWFPRHNV